MFKRTPLKLPFVTYKRDNEVYIAAVNKDFWNTAFGVLFVINSVVILGFNALINFGLITINY